MSATQAEWVEEEVKETKNEKENQGVGRTRIKAERSIKLCSISRKKGKVKLKQ
jgi:hypothetical protein